MDWQSPAESLPSAFVPEAMHATLRGTPPVSGAWRDGDHPGDRAFSQLGPFETEHGDALPHVRLAYESFGELNSDKSNAILVFHALTVILTSPEALTPVTPPRGGGQELSVQASR